jgi:hypothetical protein
MFSLIPGTVKLQCMDITSYEYFFKLTILFWTIRTFIEPCLNFYKHFLNSPYIFKAREYFWNLVVLNRINIYWISLTVFKPCKHCFNHTIIFKSREFFWNLTVILNCMNIFWIPGTIFKPCKHYFEPYEYF